MPETFDRTDPQYDPTAEAIALHLAARAALQAAAEHADQYGGAIRWTAVDDAELAWDRAQQPPEPDEEPEA